MDPLVASQCVIPGPFCSHPHPPSPLFPLPSSLFPLPLPIRSIEHDNDAEAILADLDFAEGEHATETELKLRVLEIYNAKLDERERRKAFVLERGLLEYKRMLATERRRPREEREVYDAFRPFARFMAPSEFEELVRGIVLEQRLRKRIAQLQELRRHGVRSLAEAAEYEASRRKKGAAAAGLGLGALVTGAGGAGGDDDTMGGATGARGARGSSSIIGGGGGGGGASVPAVAASAEKAAVPVASGGRRGRPSLAATAAAAAAAAGAEGAAPMDEDAGAAAGGSGADRRRRRDEGVAATAADSSASAAEGAADTAPAAPQAAAAAAAEGGGGGGGAIRPVFSIEGLPGAGRLSAKERSLCEYLALLPAQYLQIKATIINVSLVRGHVKRADAASSMIHVDVAKVNGVYDFVISAGWARPPLMVNPTPAVPPSGGP
jgi:hypothetical protein